MKIKLVWRMTYPDKPQLALPFYPRACGINIVNQSGEKLSAADFVEICWIASGSCIFECNNGNKVEANAGDYIIRMPYESRHKYSTTENDCVYYWLSFDGANAADFVKSYGYSEQAIPGQENPVPIFMEIMEYLQDTKPASMRHLITLFVRLLEYIGTPENSSANITMDECINIITKKYANPSLNINSIAKSLNIHRSTINRIFRDNLNMTPIQYLHRKRLQMAQSLLSETSLRVEEIAAKTGFSSSNYFCNLFKKSLGCSPGQYRINYHQ